MDTWGAFHSNNAMLQKKFLSEFESLVRVVKDNKLYLSLYLDPADAVEFDLLEPMCKILKDNQINVIRYQDVIPYKNEAKA